MATTDAVCVHPSNAEAFRAWDGTEGGYWADNERLFDDSLAHYRQPFLDTAAIATTDRVLDFGCGNGQTTRDAARSASEGHALGVDLSSRMIERARRRAVEEGIDNAAFLQADAQVHPFHPASFDVAISRTGAMFFGDPVAAFSNIGRALRPGGRLVLMVWQSFPQNHWVRDFLAALAAGRDLPAPPPDKPGPFSLADRDRVRSLLAAAGFSDVALEGVEEPMWFGRDTDEAYRFVRGLGIVDFLLRDLDAGARAGALDALWATVQAHETGAGVLYPSAAWLVTATRSEKA